MAAGGPPKELCEEVTCSICLEYFKNPVILDCGHNFCKSCLTQHWGGFGMTASCPHCRERDQRKNFRPNWQLANVVELVKKLQENKKGGRDQVCARHQEPLKLFCRDDRALLCVVCDRSTEHRNHSVLPLEEVPQECEPPMFPSRHILKVSESSSPYNSKGRGVSWRHPEVIDLLSIWGEQKIQEQLRRSHRNMDSFELIAQEMRRRGHKRTALECRTKTKALRLEYRRVVNHNMIPGNTKATCPYYNELHGILRGDTIVRPPPVIHNMGSGKQHEEERLVVDISKDIFSCDPEIIKASEYHGREEELLETPALDNITEDPEETVTHSEVEELEEESPIATKPQSPPLVDPPLHPEEINGHTTNDKKATLSPASRLAAIRNRRSRVGANEAAERFMRHSSAENKRFLDAQQRFLEAAAADTKAFAQYMEHVRREDEALRRDRRELIDSIKRQTLLLEQVLLNLCRSKDSANQMAADDPSSHQTLFSNEQELSEHTNGWAEACFPEGAPLAVPTASSTSMDTLDQYRPTRLLKKHVI